MASSKCVQGVVVLLTAAFPHVSMDESKIQAWVRLLGDIPDVALEAGAKDIATSGSWFPSVPELRRAALSHGPEPGAANIDSLALERVRLEARAASGDFYRGDWEDLAARFATAGRESAAEAVGRRGKALEEPPSAATRQRYAECVEELREAEAV